MSAIIKIAPNGTIQLPREILAHIRPGTLYKVHAEDAKLVLEPARAIHEVERNITATERAAAYKRWADSHRDSPGLPDSALRRESIYD